MKATKVPIRATRMLVTKHEQCACGHCRCEHDAGFRGCLACPSCIRYTWPGPGADLPEDHAR